MFFRGFLSHLIIFCPRLSPFAGTVWFWHRPCHSSMGWKKKLILLPSWEARAWGEGNASRDRGRMGKPHGMWSHLASWTPGVGGQHVGSCLLPRKKSVSVLGGGMRWPSVCSGIGESTGTWQKVSFCLDAPDICICNPFGFQSLFNLPKCVLTAL